MMAFETSEIIVIEAAVGVNPKLAVKVNAAVISISSDCTTYYQLRTEIYQAYPVLAGST
jgi:hypothetical protein